MEKIIEEITFVEDEDGDVSNYNKKKTISFDQNDKPIVPDDFNGIIRETIKGRKKKIYHQYSYGEHQSSEKCIPPSEKVFIPYVGGIK